GENPGTNTNSKPLEASSSKKGNKAPKLLPETGGTPEWMISVAGGMMLFVLGGMLLFRQRVK
ncbi:LPXTG cell wall anchor domain-containing protein, partial [Bacillus sp. JJ864]|uniref:LPXTG cell wall anchor domain-containing protein n=1 Tax=Bacillus sp. JJ864 TaxID=3122975 RepID=UPI003000716E